MKFQGSIGQGNMPVKIFINIGGHILNQLIGLVEFFDYILAETLAADDKQQNFQKLRLDKGGRQHVLAFKFCKHLAHEGFQVLSALVRNGNRSGLKHFLDDLFVHQLTEPFQSFFREIYYIPFAVASFPDTCFCEGFPGER